MPEDIELILMPDGSTIVNVCKACLIGDKDDRCKASQVEFVQALVAEGHVIEITEPKEVPA